eukprot:TRINITY_DN2892_c0_g1_i1.p1 TRINITY_DN2892_c0_g1~~TRINITY_DN2892_c0_g1_i1.p1  ORF type:complete len:110 (+),score=11.06 TRINITY_DN2892_c0_g1_i1:80-409(+)
MLLRNPISDMRSFPNITKSIFETLQSEMTIFFSSFLFLTSTDPRTSIAVSIEADSERKIQSLTTDLHVGSRLIIMKARHVCARAENWPISLSLLYFITYKTIIWNECNF